MIDIKTSIGSQWTLDLTISKQIVPFLANFEDVNWSV
jgi:hypothetical protein